MAPAVPIQTQQRDCRERKGVVMASPGALPCLKTSALNSLAPVTTAPASSHHPPSPARAGRRKKDWQEAAVHRPRSGPARTGGERKTASASKCNCCRGIGIEIDRETEG